MRVHLIQGYLKKTIHLILLLFIGVFFIQQCIITIGHVGGTSMEPTLKDGQRFFVNRFVYFVHPPQRNDIVQILDPYDEDIFIVKRVIGLPGETIIIRDNHVIVRVPDGKEFILEESFLPTNTVTQIVDPSIEIPIPPHHYFVMGDNRGSSKDSRVFGPIHRKYINGRIIQP